MLIGEPPTLGMTSGGANGSSPTSSCGGPWARSRSRLEPLARGQPADELADGVEHVLVRTLLLVEREPDDLERRPVLAQHEITLLGGGGGGELEHQRQVVGQLVALDRQTGGAVELLQSQQRRVLARGGPRASRRSRTARCVCADRTCARSAGRARERASVPNHVKNRPIASVARPAGRSATSAASSSRPASSSCVWVLQRERAELVGARTLGLPTDGASRHRASLLRSWAILMMSSSTGSSVSMNSP